MSQRVEAYFGKLKEFSWEELERSAMELAEHEKQNEARLIAHIAEIEDREDYLDLACNSLYIFCVKKLRLSEGQVYRRIQVARVCRRFPQILEALFRGGLTLTTASLIAPHLTPENVDDLITKAEGKTRREVDAYLVTLAPKEVFKPSVRRQNRRGRKRTPAMAEVLPLDEAGGENTPALPAGGPRTLDLLEPADEERYNYRFSAGREFTEKLRRLAEVLGIENPHKHLEELFDQALESVLDKKDPQRKLERRRKREERAARRNDPQRNDTEAREDGSAEPCPGKPKAETVPTQEVPSSRETSKEGAETAAASRYISSAVKERVLEKAGYQCEFRGSDGERCECRTGLQVDHMKPFAVFGSHEERHLRALCRAHNLYAAEQYYGRGFVRNKINEARRRRQAEPNTADPCAGAETRLSCSAGQA